MKIARIILLAVVCAGLPASAFAQGGFLDFMEQWSGPGPYNYGIAFDARIGCMLIGKHNTGELAQARAKRVAGQIAKGVQRAVAQQQEQVRQSTIKDEDERLFGSWFHRDTEMVRGLDGDREVTKHPCAARTRDVVAFVEAHFSHASSDVRPLFSDRPSEFVGHTNAYVLQGLLMRQFLDPAIAIGFGGGLVWFGGETLDRTPVRPIVTPLAIDVMPIRLFKPDAGSWSRVLVVHFQQNAFIRAISATDFNSASTSAYSSHAELFRSVGLSFDVLALMDR